MPKIVSENERRFIKESIHGKTIQLIKEKGVRAVTVDDIASAVGIGKGSFYTYYPSKEAWLYEVIHRCEMEAFEKITEVAQALQTNPEKAAGILKEIYTAEDSLMAYYGQNDVEMLLRRLPAKYHERTQQKGENNFHTALKLLGLQHHQVEVAAVLIDCLGHAASSREYSRFGKNEAINIMIDAMVDYITGEEK